MATWHDRGVLQCVFDPSSPLGSIDDDQACAEKQNEEGEGKNGKGVDDVIKTMEKEAVMMAENGNLEEALNMLSSAIEKAPKMASAYNNRAQVHRMMGNVEGALTDLEMALQLSNGRGFCARQAFCQRALLHELDGRKEAARNDYACAARLGSAFAKQRLTALNPYAALCNQMLERVIHETTSGPQ